MQTRMTVGSRDYFPLFPTPKLSISDQYSMDISPWVNRPFLVGRGTWTTTDLRFGKINVNSNNAGFISALPRDVFISNGSLTSVTRLARLYRCKMCLNITLTGTLTHSGMLLVAVMPPSGDNAIQIDNGRIINSMLSGPHAFLAANEASSVCLEAPFYCNTDYAVLDVAPSSVIQTPDFCNRNSNFATLMVMVLNPLQAPDSSSTSLTFVVEAVFKSLELKVPTPALASWTATVPTAKEGQSFLAKAGTRLIDSTFGITKNLVSDGLDSLRGVVRRYTGLHNPNVASLDTRMIMTNRNYLNNVDSATCIEKLDPYSCVDRIVQEPAFQTNVDEMAMSHIISKPQYIGTFTVNTTQNSGALLFSGPICPYQGGSTKSLVIANNIELMYHLTRAWRGDLNIHIQSSMNNKQNVKLKVIKLYAPPYDCVTKYPVFSGVVGAPSDLIEFSQGNQVVDISLPFNSRNSLVYNTRDYQVATPFGVGMYYIYLAQPMVVGDSTPLSCEFNIYISCSSNFTFYGYSTELGNPRRIYTPPAEVLKKGQSAEVMNKPSSPSSLLKHDGIQTELDDSRLVPLVDIRPLIRRFQFNSSGSVSIDPITRNKNITIPLASFIAETIDDIFKSSVGILPHLFYGKQCGLKFKLVVSGSSYVNVSFVPPNITSSSVSNRFTAASVVPTQPGFWYNLPAGNLRPGMYPVNQQEFPSTWAFANVSDAAIMGEYEFIIPNTTIFNYLGSSSKMAGNSILTFPESDIGTLVITFTGAPNQIIEYALFSAFTDESRFGFQVLAPTVTLPTSGNNLCSPYSNSSLVNPVLTPTNPFLYYTNTLTTFNTGDRKSVV